MNYRTLTCIGLIFFTAISSLFSDIHNPLVHLVQFLPTPIENAEKRYSDFIYYYRLKGTTDFTAVNPDSVKPTKDGGVKVTFRVSVPDPVTNAPYEYFHSYRLDGQKVDGELLEQTLISTTTK